MPPKRMSMSSVFGSTILSPHPLYVYYSSKLNMNISTLIEEKERLFGFPLYLENEGFGSQMNINSGSFLRPPTLPPLTQAPAYSPYQLSCSCWDNSFTPATWTFGSESTFDQIRIMKHIIISFDFTLFYFAPLQ